MPPDPAKRHPASNHSHVDSSRLAEVSPELERLVTTGVEPAYRYAAEAIRCETTWVAMRDGNRLATDLYLPPQPNAPTIAVRTPYGRASAKLAGALIALARCGYAVVSQDCRGTGGSEPDSWDYYVYEREDSYDLVEWITNQAWFDGFLAGCGGSYLGATQWCMALHPHTSVIAPEVCGLGVSPHTVRCHMFINAYARSVGKGQGRLAVSTDELERHMLEETLAGGYFNEPLYQPFSSELLRAFPSLGDMLPAAARRWLWQHYCSLEPAKRAKLIKLALGRDAITVVDVEALPAVFGHQIAHDAHLLPHPEPAEVLRNLHAPALMITGWYDWFLNDALATWAALQQEASESVRSRSRLLITPSAHNMPGYQEGRKERPELSRVFRTRHMIDLLLTWYQAARTGELEKWPTVTYYLMGANEWHAASAWPPANARPRCVFLGPSGTLTWQAPETASSWDEYDYDPRDPTPTIGGSIISSVYPVGSVDVSGLERRPDVLTYTTGALEHDLDVVGAIRLILYASSSATDTDFAARLSEVLPDGRAIQLQAGMLRARFRHESGEPQLLEPERIYRLEIDLWATANRFKAGNRLRLDISSADFPRFDRNMNRGGTAGDPVVAHQTIFHDREHPSHLILSVIP